jgi:hypothetical protein
MDYLIFFFIFFIFLILIIYGLPYRNTYYKNQIADLQKEIVRENFKTSSKDDVKQGASTFYDWGLKNSDDIPEECDIEPPLKSKSKSCTGGKCLGENNTYVQNDYYIYPEEKKQEQPTCGNCEAYNCKNIDRYVLKSSVPPCPDMSEFALKSMVKPCPDLKNYVLKSEIPSCPDLKNYMLKSEIPVCPERPDLSKYVLKSQIPACPTPVVCPECPVCPPAYKYIQDDPRFKNWLIRYEDDIEQKINKLYVKKTDCNKKLEELYKKGIEQGKNNAYKTIAEGAGPDVLKKCLNPSGGRIENKKPSSGENINYLNEALKRKKQEQDRQREQDKQREQDRQREQNKQREQDRQREQNKQREQDRQREQNKQREQDRQREQNKQREQDRQREQNKNRLADLEKKLEFQKNLRREENLTKNNSKKKNTKSGNDEFVLGWDPTSLGFGSINYQMKHPDIK